MFYSEIFIKFSQMTGRHIELREALMEILIKHKTVPATIVMKPLNSNNSTLHYKLGAIQKEASKLPNLKKIIMWEDRFEHAERFSKTRVYNAQNHQLEIEVNYVRPHTGHFIMKSSDYRRGGGRNRGTTHHNYHNYHQPRQEYSRPPRGGRGKSFSHKDVQNTDYSEIQSTNRPHSQQHYRHERPHRNYEEQQPVERKTHSDGRNNENSDGRREGRGSHRGNNRGRGRYRE
jgi:hypothetical protein